MSHLFLTGFMGSGKSTVGRIVAERFGRPFIDLDEEIERREGATVGSIFAERGEPAFREAEHSALEALACAASAVVATGGGVVLREDNQALLRQHGVVVYLAVTPEEAMARLGSADDRPLLAGGGLAAARDILSARLAAYSLSADHVVDTDGLSSAEVADAVIEAVEADGLVSTVCVGGERSSCDYRILIGRGLLPELGHRVRAVCGARAAALVTDANVDALYGAEATASLERAGIRVSRHLVPPGESSKSWEQAGTLLEQFAAARLDRGSVVVALGGGVVGDLAGFCAASFMRGIDLVHVPTTLLAQVDSSIGGKTGVDLSAGKNLAGAFWPPKLVLSDVSLLSSLPSAEWTNGLVETVKAALLAGGETPDRIEADLQRLVAREDAPVMLAVEEAVGFKARIVTEDLREAGQRECLNLGHTLGHALELLTGYGTLSHGLAVAEGMRFVTRLSVRLAGAEHALVERVDAMLSAIGAGRGPVLQALGSHTRGISPEDLLKAMKADKKSRDEAVRFVLLAAPGLWCVREVDDGTLLDALGVWVAGLEDGGV